jgi:hypothetical protein
MNNITPATPSPQDNTLINDLLHQVNDNLPLSGDDINDASVIISSQQLSALLRCFQQQQELLTTIGKIPSLGDPNSLVNGSQILDV